ncbi:MAG TPA: biotin transporter BioY [Candidatus Krumholzibacteria bacterium]|nr:biotin transporter BioY [Candidatus Krumholzibacteria bacterium]
MSTAPTNTAVSRPFPLSPAAAWIPAAGARRIAAGVALALAFAGLTALGANIVIPIEPVPITMQTLFVLLAGASIGAGWGSLSQWIYVGLGVAGLPIFAGGLSGAGVLAGPSGGYLISFLVTPWLVGTMLRRSNRMGWQIVSFVSGQLLILLLGVAHLTLFYTHDLSKSLMVGVVPFLPGDAFKIAAAISIHRSSQALVRHYRG